jgi:hypothetical protein
LFPIGQLLFVEDFSSAYSQLKKGGGVLETLS